MSISNQPLPLDLHDVYPLQGLLFNDKIDPLTYFTPQKHSSQLYKDEISKRYAPYNYKSISQKPTNNVSI